MADTIKVTAELMKSIDEFKSEWYYNWHKIDPIKSNYVDFNQYCRIQDVIAMTAEDILRQSNDSLKNHDLATIILQGPEYEFKFGSRFIRWLKKKLFSEPRPERLRIILDDKYFSDIDMAVFNFVPEVHWHDLIAEMHLQILIKEAKEVK